MPIPLDGPDQTLSETRISDKSADFVRSSPVRSGPCSGIWHLPRQPVAEDVTLAARSAEDRVQSGSADVQSPQHIEVAVPPSPNAGPTT